MPTRVLVVEDSATQAESLRALLADAGYQVAVASSGEHGLAQFEAGEFNVVISDIIMPGMVDGYALCHRIKAGPRRETPVVLLTSLSDPLDIIRGLECGADNFFVKSVDPDLLLSRLELLLTTRETRTRAKLRMGVKLFFMGREFTITSEREQILDLLISTFEDAVRQNRELLLQEEALEATNKELEAFTYSISHDLRTPLGQVDGFCQLLLDQFSARLDPTALEYVAHIHEAAQHMKRMVNELLNLGHVGRRDLRPQPTELRPLVDAALFELESQTRGRRIQWQIGPLPRVQCDPELMESVLANLLSNAVKFTRGRDTAVIQVGQMSGGAETVIFVRDNGAGFDMQYADRLFGVFQRLHRSHEFEGTGVGLATVQRIIHKHGGRIWAESTLGEGASFYVALPAAESGKT
jgi:two-component system sensor histidine kinase/response regulator